MTSLIERVFNAPVENLDCTEGEGRLYSRIYRVKATIGGSLFPLVIKTWSDASAYRLQTEAIKTAHRIFERDSGIHIPFLGCDDAGRMLLMDYVRNPSIESLAHCELELRALYLPGWKRRLERACQSAGRWLQQWHALEIRQANVGSLLSAYLEGRTDDLDLLERSHRHALTTLVERLGVGDVGFVHGDFTPWNVLWSSERTTILDFGVGEWSRMSPAWDFQTMRIGLASELLFATRSPAHWFERLAAGPLRAFEQGYGGARWDPVIANACAAMRHFNLYAADVRGPKGVRKRADWHLASIKRILSDPCSPRHRMVGIG